MTEQEFTEEAKSRARKYVKSLAVSGAVLPADVSSIPIKRGLRTGYEVFQTANVCFEDKDYVRSFIMYNRYATLMIEELPKHVGYNDLPTNDINQIKKKLKVSFARAEKLKEYLVEQYTRVEVKRLLEEQEDRRQIEELEQLRLHEIATNDYLKESEQPQPNNFKPIPAPRLNIDYPSVEPLRDDLSNSQNLAVHHIPPPEPSQSSPAAVPIVDRSTKPTKSNNVFGGYSMLPVDGLREVIVPSAIVTQFSNLAAQNTLNNVETCAILCGNQKSGQLVVTHMCVLPQSGTADSCSVDEAEDFLLPFQEKYGVFTTHPTQTAFLSSVDMHTHCPYQMLLEEAIAVVVSPQYQEHAIFHLTPGYGLNEISSCSRRDFHLHETAEPLFEVCPHARFSDGLQCTVVDLRKR